ncbi:MAG TPA: plasmid partition protein ParG [Acidobacteriaceae bacterium]|nr:plasmid partition protein ParG [Acidobacteriaceae bacterium]
MSSIPRTETTETKRLNVNIPIQLHNQFKSLAAARGENMTDLLLKFVSNYVREHSPRGRRR